MVDDRRFTIEMTLNFDIQDVDFRTTWMSSVPRFHRPPPLLRVLTPEFVPFFVFNGELAHDLLDPRKTRAREALEVQFQLTSLNYFSTLMDRYWEQKTRNSTAKGAKGLTQRRNKLNALTRRRSQLILEQKNLKNEFDTVMARRYVLAEQYEKRFNVDLQAQKDRERLNEELTRTKDNLSALLTSTFTEIRQPHFVSSRFTAGLQALRENFEKLKLPENVAKEFFEDLAQAGRPTASAGRR